VILATFAKAHCPRCRGRGTVTHTGREMLGGKTVRTLTYDVECPWCVGAQTWSAEQLNTKL
jgi:hypothetical protein